MMDLTEAIVCDAVRAVGESRVQSSESRAGNSADVIDNSQLSTLNSQLSLPWGEGEIDFTPPWPRRTYAELFAEYAGCEVADAAAVRAKAAEEVRRGRIKPEFLLEIEAGRVHPDVLVNEVFEACVEEHLRGPLFCIDYPASLCPLTKRKQNDPTIAERFELYIEGVEIANAYTELNDPKLQEELFRTQLEGQPEEESMAKMDREFIHALRVGMPPAGGVGIGIDRLVMLLTASRSIREVIFFPLLRPEVSAEAGSRLAVSHRIDVEKSRLQAGDKADSSPS
jgi:lysyl-tRNA synthetase class 2